MERALSQDERIRRAEEIYARRKDARDRSLHTTVNISSSKEHKSLRLFKRLMLQTLICFLIYFIFYLINTTNYSFSNETMNKTEELISHEVDFITIYNCIANTLNKYISSINFGNSYSLEQETLNNNIIINNNVLDEDKNDINIINNENIVDENANNISEINNERDEKIAILTNEEETSQEEIKNIELSETDRIKQKYSFINPVERLDFF